MTGDYFTGGEGEGGTEKIHLHWQAFKINQSNQANIKGLYFKEILKSIVIEEENFNWLKSSK